MNGEGRMSLGQDYTDKHAATVPFIRRNGGFFDDIRWTSDPTPWDENHKVKVYNCFGFVLDIRQWMQPTGVPGDPEGDPRYCWRTDIDPDESRTAWVERYIRIAEANDFIDCGQDSSWENDFEKIVLFHKTGLFAHAALQISPDRWQSKMGELSDFEHSLPSMLTAYIGHRMTFMKRTRRTRYLP